MDVSALILLHDSVDIYRGDIEKAVDRVLAFLPVGIEQVSLILPLHLKGVINHKLPTIFSSKGEEGFLVSLLEVLDRQNSGRLLVLSGVDVSINSEKVENLLDFSDRLPHMSVVSANLGVSQDFPLVLPNSVKQDLKEYLSTSKDRKLLKSWLEQEVYIECELSLSS